MFAARHNVALAAVVTFPLLGASAAQAAPITYDFTVTGTSGPLKGVSSEWGVKRRWPTARSGWHAAEIGGPIQSRAFHCRPRSELEAGDRRLFGTSAFAATCSFADLRESLRFLL
jgi:hypothetical protein